MADDAMVTNPSSFAIVGMMAFFGGAAKPPLAVIVMIAEMTGGYGPLAPSMIDIMARQLLVAYPEEDLFSASTRMMTKGVGRLQVVSHDDREAMIGIIARTDIAKAIENHRSTQDSAKEQGHFRKDARIMRACTH